MINLIYQSQKAKFPLIASVIEGIQTGQILQNREDSPTHFFIINKFGFCQEFFSEFDEKFFEKIKQLILKQEYKKLRCYVPSERLKNFLNSIDFGQKSERIQFEYLSTSEKIDSISGFRLEKVDKKNIKLVDFGLDLNNRYWSGEDDFINNANAVAAFDADIPAGICYSAGNGLGKAETDVFIDESYRKTGLGYALCVKFIQECIKKGTKPGWDCYLNNAGSVNLAKKLGFKESFKYDFYNINGDN